MSTVDTDYRISAQRLGEMADEVHKVNEANGWFESERSYDDGIALIHTEISEVMEAYRQWGMDDATEFVCELKKKHSDLTLDTDPPIEHLCKPEGVGSELADILVRLLDEAYRQGVDIPQGSREMNDPGYSFSKRVNVLHERTAALYGSVDTAMTNGFSRNLIEQQWERGLCGILAQVEAAAHWWGIDLMAEYTRKIAYNRTRGHRHGGKRL